jgi:hypothetical protein
MDGGIEVCILVNGPGIRIYQESCCASMKDQLPVPVKVSWWVLGMIWQAQAPHYYLMWVVSLVFESKSGVEALGLLLSWFLHYTRILRARAYLSGLAGQLPRAQGFLYKRQCSFLNEPSSSSQPEHERRYSFLPPSCPTHTPSPQPPPHHLISN